MVFELCSQDHVTYTLWSFIHGDVLDVLCVLRQLMVPELQHKAEGTTFEGVDGTRRALCGDKREDFVHFF
jgi:hypothetical protein